MTSTLTDPTPSTGAGGNLHDAISDEALNSSPSVLKATRHGHLTGLQQFFTSPTVAAFVKKVLGNPRSVIDLTAGGGDLLAPFAERNRYGIEVDKQLTRSTDVRYHAIAGDLQQVYPLLRMHELKFAAAVLNPPFGLDWTDTEGAKANSALLTLRYAQDLLADNGHGALVCGAGRLVRDILTQPEAAGIYAVIEIPGPLLHERVELDAAIAFFCHPKVRRTDEPLLRQRAETAEELDNLAAVIAAAQQTRTSAPLLPWTGTDPTELVEAFGAVRDEHERRERQRSGRYAAGRYDLQLMGSKLSVRPSTNTKLLLARRRELQFLTNLSGQASSYFALNEKEWRRARQLAGEGIITIDPGLERVVGDTLQEAARLRVPLRPLAPQMRLGFLTDLETITCIKDWPEHGFRCGERYRISTRSKQVTQTGEITHQKRSGDTVVRRFEDTRRLMEIEIGSSKFDESPKHIGGLIEHFEIPDPGCVASRFPDRYERALDVLRDIEAEHGFELKGYQRDDIARMLVKQFAIAGHEPGLGKSVILRTLAEGAIRLDPKTKRRILLVCPQDLIAQWQEELRRFYGETATVISDPIQARKIARWFRDDPDAGGVFITYYEALSIVGKKNDLLPSGEPVHKQGLAMRSARKRAIDPRTGERYADLRPVVPRSQQFPFTSASCCPSCRAMANDSPEAGGGGTADGTWEPERGVCGACGYVHRKLRQRNIGNLLSTAFADGVICIDEITEIAGDSLRSKAVRALRGRHRYAGTGTPIRNYLVQVWWLLIWLCKPGSVAFPYSYDGRGKFEEDFAVVRRVFGEVGSEQEGRQVVRKLLPQVTNLSLWWRLSVPLICRRLKTDTGEPIVACTIHEHVVPLGVNQREQNEAWLRNFVQWFERVKGPEHPMVKFGTVERFQAALGLYAKLNYAATMPALDQHREDPEIECPGSSNWTPGALRVLQIALKAVDEGRQVVIGSDVMGAGKFLAEALQDAGVNAVHVLEEGRDGTWTTKNPKKRAVAVNAFKRGEAQVLCTGIRSLRLGHSLQNAQTLIVFGLEWSYEANEQFINRVWRLTSPEPVDVHYVIPGAETTLAGKKWELNTDKRGANNLALDGELVEQNEEQIDQERVVREMRKQGIPVTGDEVPEEEVERAWKALCARRAANRPALRPVAVPAQPQIAAVPVPAAGPQIAAVPVAAAAAQLEPVPVAAAGPALAGSAAPSATLTGVPATSGTRKKVKHAASADQLDLFDLAA